MGLQVFLMVHTVCPDKYHTLNRVISCLNGSSSIFCGAMYSPRNSIMCNKSYFKVEI